MSDDSKTPAPDPLDLRHKCMACAVELSNKDLRAALRDKGLDDTKFSETNLVQIVASTSYMQGLVDAGTFEAVVVLNNLCPRHSSIAQRLTLRMLDDVVNLHQEMKEGDDSSGPTEIKIEVPKGSSEKMN